MSEEEWRWGPRQPGPSLKAETIPVGRICRLIGTTIGMCSSVRKKKLGPISKPFEIFPNVFLPFKGQLTAFILSQPFVLRKTIIPKYIESIFTFPFSSYFIQTLTLQGHSG